MTLIWEWIWPKVVNNRREGGVVHMYSIMCVYVCVCVLRMRTFLTVCMFFSLRWVVNGVLMDCASLMGSLASDLGWCHAGQTHECIYTHAQTHVLHTNQIDTVKLDIALGLIMTTRTAKYLTPRLSVYDANTHRHTHAYIKDSHTQFHFNQEWHIIQQLSSRNRFWYWTLPNPASLSLGVCVPLCLKYACAVGLSQKIPTSFPPYFSLNTKYNADRSKSVQSFLSKFLWHRLSPVCEIPCVIPDKNDLNQVFAARQLQLRLIEPLTEHRSEHWSDEMYVYKVLCYDVWQDIE